MQGRIEIDAIIGIIIFLSFLTWGFFFYNTLTAEESYPLTEVSSDINDKIIEYLMVDVTTLPMEYTAPNTTNDAVLYLNYIWPSGTKNSTKIFAGTTQLSCQFVGNTLYWQADVTNESSNYFTMRYSTQDKDLQCNSTFTIEDESQVIPFAGETRKMISLANINTMKGTGYSTFKNSLGIDRNFLIEFNISGTLSTYGESLPVASDVISHKTSNVIEESNARVDINVMVF